MTEAIQQYPSKKLMRYRISTPSKNNILNALKTETHQKSLTNHNLLKHGETEDRNTMYTTRLSDTVQPEPPKEPRSSFYCESLLDYPEFAQLKRQFQKRVRKYVGEWNLFRGGKSNLKITESWFNIMREGNSLTFHRHERSIITGAYYPFLPEGSANLILEGEEIDLEEGYLYLFPSWAEHGTEENKSRERYVISFNVGVVT